MLPGDNPTIGSLRRRVTIVAPFAGNVSDPDGQPVEAPADVATVWGSLVPVVGSEEFVGAEVASEVSHVVTVRWRPDLVADGSRWRARIGDRLFEGKQVLEHLGEVRFLRWFVVEQFERPVAP